MKISSLVQAMALAVVANRAPARADVDACVADHRLVQTAREVGRYIESRDAAARCAQSSCPQLIRQDCSAWYEDLAASTPSLVIDLRDDAGHDVGDAHVTVGDRPLDEAMHGRAVSLDPGSHELRIDAQGYEPKVERIVLREGEKGRRVAVTLRPKRPASGVHTGTEAARMQSSSDRTPPQRMSPAVITLGAIGVAGLTTFAALGTTGKLAHNQLDDDGCKPDCAQSDVDYVNHLYLGANIAAAVGGTAAIAAALTYFLEQREEPRVQASVSLRGVSLRGAF